MKFSLDIQKPHDCVSLNHPNVCWQDNRAASKQPRTFLKYINDNFLTQVIMELLREGDLLDLIPTSKSPM